MCYAKNKISKYFNSVLVQFLMKYPKLSFVLALFGIVVFPAWLFTRGSCSQHSKVIYPLFHAQSPVRDINNGSVDVLHALLRQSSITFVMYYAHWCSQSVKLVYDFHRASKKFEGHVSFIAINCWNGACRQPNFPNSYPLLFLYHTHFEPIQYRGRQKFNDMVHFLQHSIRPFTYISNKVIAEEFLNQSQPCLFGFFNGTNYKDKNYGEFFGAALHKINTASGLQFGVITSRPVAVSLGLEKFGEIVLINSLKPRKIHLQTSKYNWTTLLQWADETKIEYVRELDADIMQSSTFGSLVKAQPSLILFVPLNDKNRNKEILDMYRTIAVSYHNCSCRGSKPSPKSAEEPGDCHGNVHGTSCQSLPLSYDHGMQNNCDVCRNCRETCPCSESKNSFPLQTFSVLRGFALPRNSCRSLRRNFYEEKNALSVCCFDSKTQRLRGLLDVGRSASTGGISAALEPSLNREEHLKILAEKFEQLNKDIESGPSENNIGMFNNLLGNLIKIFGTPAAHGSELKRDSISSANTENETSSVLEGDETNFSEFGTCDHPGKVVEFAGASCYSNMTVKFYFMDSRKFWNYALAFGVKNDTLPRVALVLVDTKSEAQYVLSEDTRLSSASIVDFVMKFKHGNLTRRFRSAPVPNQTCAEEHGCLIEVVSKTFVELVLDNSKDVFLMYYTPWCGFCKSVKHVIISLVDHYKHSEHIRIARLNADLNDLPWEYTVDSYPSFIFFPAKRKDLSVKFPENEKRTLENFIKFVEAHTNRDDHVKLKRKRVTGHVRIHSLQRNLNYLKRQNINLRTRLNREIIAKEKAEKGRLKAERQFGAFLDQTNEANFDYKTELQKLSTQNAELLREILSAKDELSKYRKIAQKTVEELRKRNWELHSTIVSLEEANSLFSGSSKIKT